MPVTKTAAALEALYVQIEEICRHFTQIRQEASNIMEAGEMPDATLHLNDVLQSTEEATTTIIEAVTKMGGICESSSMSAEDKAKASEQVGLVYEACCFQDISGQRIKKVLNHLNVLESKLLYLSETARGQMAPEKPVDPYLNGPALSTEAPAQEDIDAMFKQA